MSIQSRDKAYVLALVLLAALVAVDWDNFTFDFALWLVVDFVLLAAFRLTQLAFQLRRRASRSAAWLSWVNVWVVFPVLCGWTVYGTYLFVVHRQDLSWAFAIWIVYNWATIVGFLIVITIISRHIARGGIAHFRSPEAIRSFIEAWQQSLEYGIEPATRGLNENEIAQLPTRAVTEQDADRTCSICLGDVSVGERVRGLPCKHVFHSACIDQWLLVRDTCPNCVRRVPSERSELLPV